MARVNRPRISTRDRLRQHGYSWWRASLWTGMDFPTWWRIMRLNRFAISASRLPRTLVVSGSTAFTSAARHLPRTRNTPAATSSDDPVFIIGHWRTGTSFLHDLLAVDPGLVGPTVADVFLPHHPDWLVRLFGPLTRILGHGKRPMDNVIVEDGRPQEDEFALLMRGAPSPYEALIFPNEQGHHARLASDGYSADELASRKTSIRAHFDHVRRRSPGARPVLKSPTYTGQIDLLLELFPDARFVHLVRHPDVLLPSTVWTMRALQFSQGLQLPDEGETVSMVVDNLKRMYAGFRRHTPALSERRLLTVRYEDLVAAPVDSVKEIHQRLDLGPGPALEPLERRLADLESYETNVHEISERQRSLIRREWSFYFDDYGYSID